MFKKKSSYNVSPESPVFYVRHAGYTQTDLANGPGSTKRPVDKILSVSKNETDMKRIAVTINSTGLSIDGVDEREQFRRRFPIGSISYCCADRDWNPRVFAWIHSDNGNLFCHAVLCSSMETAQAMALVLARAFQVAYFTLKVVKTKDSEKKRANKKRVSSFSTSDKTNSEQGVSLREHETLSDHSDAHTMTATRGEQNNDGVSQGDNLMEINNGIMDKYDYSLYGKDERILKLMSGDAPR